MLTQDVLQGRTYTFVFYDLDLGANDIMQLSAMLSSCYLNKEMPFVFCVSPPAPGKLKYPLF